MAYRARWQFGASFLVLSLIINSTAFAAAENSGQEKPSQAEPESKSYLPPWMQGQGGGGNSSAPPSSAAVPGSKSAAASDNDPIKKKARAGSQERRSHRHNSQPDGFVSGFAGLFGRCLIMIFRMPVPRLPEPALSYIIPTAQSLDSPRGIPFGPVL